MRPLACWNAALPRCTLMAINGNFIKPNIGHRFCVQTRDYRPITDPLEKTSTLLFGSYKCFSTVFLRSQLWVHFGRISSNLAQESSLISCLRPSWWSIVNNRCQYSATSQAQTGKYGSIHIVLIVFTANVCCMWINSPKIYWTGSFYLLIGIFVYVWQLRDFWWHSNDLYSNKHLIMVWCHFIYVLMVLMLTRTWIHSLISVVKPNIVL